MPTVYGVADHDRLEWDKYELEVDTKMGWTVTDDPGLRRAFTAALPAWLRYGPDQPCVPNVGG